MPAYFFKSEPVAGHAETPENSANQPLVNGHGPFVQSSHRPPPAATIVHAQAAIQPSAAPHGVRLMVFCLSFANLDSMTLPSGRISNWDGTDRSCTSRDSFFSLHL